jgi:GNAT superfamily N-acetyltransferase
MTDGERQQFIAFVLKGGQVNAHSLPGLVDRAVALVTLHDGQSLIGTAAVKVPNLRHRHGDFAKAGVKERTAEFPFELGWVHSSQSGKGNGRKLLTAAVEAAGDRNVYATTKTDEMKHMLPDYGFVVLGRPFQSAKDQDTNLMLYVRSAR